MDNVKKYLTPVVFSIAFGAFLWYTVPKNAAIFLIYSESHGGGGLFWQVTSYLPALSVDSLVGFLTYTTTMAGRRWWHQIDIWGFVIILAAWSSYFNWVFDQLNAPGANPALVWSEPIPWLPGWDIQQLTALIVSCTPFVGLGFVRIARQIRREKYAISIEELRRQRAELTERNILVKDISAAKLDRGTSQALGYIEAGKTLAKSLNPWAKKDQDTPVKQETNAPAPYPQPSQQAEVKLPHDASGEEESNSLDDLTHDEQIALMVETYPATLSWLSGPKKSVPIDTVVEITGVSRKVIETRIKKGVLKRPPNGPNLILKPSLVDWWKKSWQQETKKPQSDRLHIVKLEPIQDETKLYHDNRAGLP